MLMLLMSFVSFSVHCPLSIDDRPLRIWASKINKNVITGQAKCNTNRIWPTSEDLRVAAFTVLFTFSLSLFLRTLLSFIVHSFARLLIAKGD